MLEEIAFNAILDRVIFFPQEKIEGIIHSRGLELDQIRELGLFKVENGLGSFIHLTFQEFFAARHIANFYFNNSREQAQRILRVYKFHPQFELIWRMVGGYLSLQDREDLVQTYFDDLFDEPKDLAVRRELNLLARCFEECPKRNQIKQYKVFVEVCVSYIKEMISEDENFKLLNGSPSLLNHLDMIQTIIELLNGLKAKKVIVVLEKVVRSKQWIPLEIVRALTKQVNAVCDTTIDLIQVIGNLVKGGQQLPLDTRKKLLDIVCSSKVDDCEVRFCAAVVIYEVVRAGQALSEETLGRLIDFLEENERIFEISIIIERAIIYLAGKGQALAVKTLNRWTDLKSDPYSGATFEVKAIRMIMLSAEEGLTLAEKTQMRLLDFIRDPNADTTDKFFAVKTFYFAAESGQIFAKETLKELVNLLSDPIGINRLEGCNFYMESVLRMQVFSEGMLEKIIDLFGDSKVNYGARISAARVIIYVARNGLTLPEKLLEGLFDFMREFKANDLAKSYAIEIMECIGMERQVLPEEILEILMDFLRGLTEKNLIESRVVKGIKYGARVSQTFAVEVLVKLVGFMLDPKAAYSTKNYSAAVVLNIAQSEQTLVDQALGRVVDILKDTKASYRNRVCATEALTMVIKREHVLTEELQMRLFNILQNPNADRFSRCLVAGVIGYVAKAGQTLDENVLEVMVDLLRVPETSPNIKAWVSRALMFGAKSRQIFSKKAQDGLINYMLEAKGDIREIINLGSAINYIDLMDQVLPHESLVKLAILVSDRDIVKSCGLSF